MSASEMWDYPGEYVAVADGEVVARVPAGPEVLVLMQMLAELQRLPADVRDRAVVWWVPGEGGAP